MSRSGGPLSCGGLGQACSEVLNEEDVPIGTMGWASWHQEAWKVLVPHLAVEGRAPFNFTIALSQHQHRCPPLPPPLWIKS
jgi:hypothetical protein